MRCTVYDKSMYRRKVIDDVDEAMGYGLQRGDVLRTVDGYRYRVVSKVFEMNEKGLQPDLTLICEEL